MKSMTRHCQRIERWSTLKGPMEDIVMKGNEDRQHDPGTSRLNAVQQDIRARCEKLPRHLRRSIDAYRQSVGMIPLWGSSLDRTKRT